MLEHLALGLHVALTPSNILYCFIGVTLGNLVGTIPGLGSLAAISILLPITYFVPETGGLIMLAGLYYGAVYGGATSAILLNIPHTATSMVCLDGYPMAQKGRAGVALFLTTIASLCGSVVGIIVVAFFAPILASVALEFESPEYFALMFLGLAGAAILARGNPTRSFITMILGMLLGMIGIDVNSGQPRFTFGATSLMDGVNIGIVAIGLFGVAEVMINAGRARPTLMRPQDITWKTLIPTREDVRTAIPAILRGVGLGSLLGILPSAGTILAPIMGYSIEKQIAREPDRFGHGALEGIVAPEAAANASSQTAFVPMLTLGIPTDPVMAVMLGAMMIKGLSPGPSFISDHPDMFWGLVVSFVIGNALLVVWHLPLIGLWVRLLTIPFNLLYPPVLVFVCVGAYSIRQSPLDVGTVLVFGLIGYGMRVLGFQPAPLLIGFILGPLIEENLRRALSVSRGNPAIFVERPISFGVLCLAILVMFWTFRRTSRRQPLAAPPINA
jgi:putative tricarboxylic transport membrane protein